MAYDPQANRRRPQPDAADPAPVDSILGVPEVFAAAGDQAPIPAVTPEPADPPPDSLLVNTGVAAALGGLFALVTLRHLWKRHLRKTALDDE
ncbi:MAG: hypothetical protein ACI9C1_002769 [Candidatus Aldehydirespiratoraceae bacterium]|jgi:hypothetical protein